MYAYQVLGQSLHAFFLAKVPFLTSFEYRKGCGHIEKKFSPGDTNLNIFEFVGLTPPIQE